MTLEEMAAKIARATYGGGVPGVSLDADEWAACMNAATAILTAQAAERGVDAGVVEALDRLIKLAFEIPAPNPYTPRLVMQAQAIQHHVRALLAAQGGRADDGVGRAPRPHRASEDEPLPDPQTQPSTEDSGGDLAGDGGE